MPKLLTEEKKREIKKKKKNGLLKHHVFRVFCAFSVGKCRLEHVTGAAVTCSAPYLRSARGKKRDMCVALDTDIYFPRQK